MASDSTKFISSLSEDPIDGSDPTAKIHTRRKGRLANLASTPGMGKLDWENIYRNTFRGTASSACSSWWTLSFPSFASTRHITTFPEFRTTSRIRSYSPLTRRADRHRTSVTGSSRKPKKSFFGTDLSTVCALGTRMRTSQAYGCPRQTGRTPNERTTCTDKHPWSANRWTARVDIQRAGTTTSLSGGKPCPDDCARTWDLAHRRPSCSSSASWKDLRSCRRLCWSAFWFCSSTSPSSLPALWWMRVFCSNCSRSILSLTRWTSSFGT